MGHGWVVNTLYSAMGGDFLSSRFRSSSFAAGLRLKQFSYIWYLTCCHCTDACHRISSLGNNTFQTSLRIKMYIARIGFVSKRGIYGLRTGTLGVQICLLLESILPVYVSQVNASSLYPYPYLSNDPSVQVIWAYHAMTWYVICSPYRWNIFPWATWQFVQICHAKVPWNVLTVSRCSF